MSLLNLCETLKNCQIPHARICPSLSSPCPSSLLRFSISSGEAIPDLAILQASHDPCCCQPSSKKCKRPTVQFMVAVKWIGSIVVWFTKKGRTSQVGANPCFTRILRHGTTKSQASGRQESAICSCLPKRLAQSISLRRLQDPHSKRAPHQTGRSRLFLSSRKAAKQTEWHFLHLASHYIQGKKTVYRYQT